MFAPHTHTLPFRAFTLSPPAIHSSIVTRCSISRSRCTLSALAFDTRYISSHTPPLHSDANNSLHSAAGLQILRVNTSSCCYPLFPGRSTKYRHELWFISTSTEASSGIPAPVIHLLQPRTAGDCSILRTFGHDLSGICTALMILACLANPAAPALPKRGHSKDANVV